eukprot:scaffold16204_cov54-Phaeocystis_antarctica.AAC.1
MRDENVSASDKQGLLWCRRTVGSRRIVRVALAGAFASEGVGANVTSPPRATASEAARQSVLLWLQLRLPVSSCEAAAATDEAGVWVSVAQGMLGAVEFEHAVAATPLHAASALSQ